MVVRFLRGEEMMKEWRKEGLTLVELLIVVAVIAALAALLFPVFQSVRERVYIASCTSNLKQLYNALQMYEEDWGELPYTPPGTHRYWENMEIAKKVHNAFYQSIYPYVRDHNIFICPAHTGAPPPAGTCYWYYYPYARWKGYPITSNLVLLFCPHHSKPHIIRNDRIIIIYFAPRLVCLMDGSIHLVHSARSLIRHRLEDVPFTYP